MKTAGPTQARLVLASASPRRLELLAQAGLGLHSFPLPQQVDENPLPGEAPETYVQRLAQAKAKSALVDPSYPAPLPVLAADTTVVCADRILGKPATLAEAHVMLGLLSGRSHEVLTAVCVASPDRLETVLVPTTVWFRPLAPAEIEAYWASGEPRDKAGGYAVQGLGAMFVSRIDGSYSGVVGLPLFETLRLLADFGFSSTALLRRAAA